MAVIARARTTIYGPDAIEKMPVAPTVQYSSNLYRFTNKLDYLIDALQRRAFVPRYNIENFKFLDLGLNDLSFPMVCFCDIPLRPERITKHMDRYGSYGIGFKKQWGIANGLNPVHYIVEGSHFADTLFNAYYKGDGLEQLGDHEPSTALEKLGLAILAYAKPLQGKDEKQDDSFYCYQDECEWRYIPRNAKPTLRYLRGNQINEIRQFQNELNAYEKAYLRFDYSDIVCLAAKDNTSRQQLVKAINDLVDRSFNK